MHRAIRIAVVGTAPQAPSNCHRIPADHKRFRPLLCSSQPLRRVRRFSQGASSSLLGGLAPMHGAAIVTGHLRTLAAACDWRRHNPKVSISVFVVLFCFLTLHGAHCGPHTVTLPFTRAFCNNWTAGEDGNGHDLPPYIYDSIWLCF